jgi:hypothetical protein
MQKCGMYICRGARASRRLLLSATTISIMSTIGGIFKRATGLFVGNNNNNNPSSQTRGGINQANNNSPATASKFVRCIRVESKAIPCYIEDTDKVWRETHMGDEGMCKIRYLAQYRCDIKYFSPQNVQSQTAAVCLVPQQQSSQGGGNVYLSREMALKYFYIDGGLTNQDDSAQESLTKIVLNSTDDWTQNLPHANVSVREPPSVSPSLMTRIM